MSRFLDYMHLRPLLPEEQRERGLQAQHYVVERSVRYRSDIIGTLITPAGFLTDQGSVPEWIPRWIADGNAPYLVYSSLPHDMLYWCRGCLPDGRVLSRKTCDEVLKEGIADSGAPWWRQQLVYWAVRAFGWSRWRVCQPGGDPKQLLPA